MAKTALHAMADDSTTGTQHEHDVIPTPLAIMDVASHYMCAPANYSPPIPQIIRTTKSSQKVRPMGKCFAIGVGLHHRCMCAHSAMDGAPSTRTSSGSCA